MKIAEAHKLLIKKMDQHGLTELGWEPKLDNAKVRFGLCDYGKKVISLSRPLSEANPVDEVVDTIFHEIAHALAFIQHGEDCGHDERWKIICREIGARPEACYDEEDVVMLDALWSLVHLETGEVFASFMKAPKSKDYSKVWIRGRKDETFGKLELRANRLSEIKTFSKPVLDHLNTEIMEAIESVLAEKGLTVERTKASFSDYEFDLSLKFRTGLPDGKTPDQAAFEEQAFIFGLEESDYHRVFRSRGKSYVLCGLKPNNRKYPVIGLCPRTGKRFKFESNVLETLEPIKV